MVAHSRTPLRAHQLRALNQPQPITVTCEKRGLPTEVYIRRRRHRIAAVKDRWRLDDEWWRDPIRRMYYWVEYEEGTHETLYRDLCDGLWYRQKEAVGRPYQRGDETDVR